MGLKLSKLRAEMAMGLRLMRKKVRDPMSLEPGQHIYAYRRWGLYTHHGIYTDNATVIHFTRTEPKQTLLPSSQLKAGEELNHRPCEKCCSRITQDELVFDRGVTKTCLDCFRQDGTVLRPVHLYAYGVSQWWFGLKVPGSCTTVPNTRSLGKVVEAAQGLLFNRNFGQYNLLSNNCEHFASFCNTGLRISEQTKFWGRWMVAISKFKACWTINDEETVKNIDQHLLAINPS